MMIQTTHAHSRESRAPLAHLSFLLMSPSTSFRFALLAAASSPLCIASGTPPCAASLAASVSFRLLSIAVSIWHGARANGRADGAHDDDETRWKDRKRPTARARGGRKCQCSQVLTLSSFSWWATRFFCFTSNFPARHHPRIADATIPSVSG